MAAQLVHGTGETFELPSTALEPLARVLRRAVEGTRALEEVQRAVQLIAALYDELASPTAARQLSSILLAERKALPLLKKLGAVDEATGKLRRFLKSEGRAPLFVPPSADGPKGVSTLDLRAENANRKARTRTRKRTDRRKK